MRASCLVLLALLTACDNGAASEPRDSPVRFVVTNALLAPVDIAVDGTPHVRLTNDKSSGLTVSSRAEWLTWTSAKPTDANGSQIPDDIGEVKIRIGGIGSALTITNVIGDQTYITASLYNDTRSQVSIGVFDGSAVRCASILPAASDSVHGFTQIGYYRLLPATEVRAYHDPRFCTGNYVSWPTSQLKGYAPKSGLLNLLLATAP